MNVITLVLVLMVVGFCLWLLLTYVKMHAGFKAAILAVAAVGLALWVLDATDIYHQRFLRW